MNLLLFLSSKPCNGKNYFIYPHTRLSTFFTNLISLYLIISGEKYLAKGNFPFGFNSLFPFSKSTSLQTVYKKYWHFGGLGINIHFYRAITGSAYYMYGICCTVKITRGIITLKNISAEIKLRV